MFVAGNETRIATCQHCTHARIWWLENEPGKAPQFAYSGFPGSGQIVLSKAKIILVCRQCQSVVDVLKDELTRPV